MIVNKVFYGVKCNRCHEIYETTDDLSFFEDENDAIENAEEYDWLTIQDKHYCPNCYKTVKDDNGRQEFVVEEPIPQEVFQTKDVLEKLLHAMVNLDWDDNFYYLSYVEYYGVKDYKMIVPFLDYLLDTRKSITEESYDNKKYKKITLSFDREKKDDKKILYRNKA